VLAVVVIQAPLIAFTSQAGVGVGVGVDPPPPDVFFLQEKEIIAANPISKASSRMKFFENDSLIYLNIIINSQNVSKIIY
jgi:hypothetical protein